MLFHYTVNSNYETGKHNYIIYNVRAIITTIVVVIVVLKFNVNLPLTWHMIYIVLLAQHFLIRHITCTYTIKLKFIIIIIIVHYNIIILIIIIIIGINNT